MKNRKKQLVGLLLLCAVLLFGGIGLFTASVSAASTSITVSVKHPALDTIKLKWNAIDGADGYHVYMSQDNGQKYLLVDSISNTSMVFDKLTRNKIYYFKIAAYKDSDGKETEFAASSVVKSNSNRIGIDVSHWQGNINWTKVKSAGIEFAFIKAGQPYWGDSTYTYSVDSKFKDNIKNAIAAKMPVGVYSYSKATTVARAKQEANSLLKLIKGYKISYPVVIDIEDSCQTSNSKVTNTSLVNAFCKVIRDAGYTPMVYSGCSYSKGHLNINDIDADLWIAHYSKDGSVVNNYYHYYSETNHYPYTRIWQYSNQAISVSGIAGNVDHNYEFDLKESVAGTTHFNVVTGEITYKCNSSDTLKSVALKNNTSIDALLSHNAGITSSTTLSGKTLKIEYISLSKPTLKVSTYQCKDAYLSWNGVLGGNQYTVLRSNTKDRDYEEIRVLNSTARAYIDRTVEYGKTYYYRVVASNPEASTDKAYSPIVTFTPTVYKVANLKAVSQNYNTVKLTWSKVAGATDYTVQYATSANGTYKKLATLTTNTYTKTGLTVGRTYYFRVITNYVATEGTHVSDAAQVSAAPVVNKVASVKVSGSAYNSVSLSWKKTSDAGLYYIYRSTKSGSGYKNIGKTTKLTYKDSTVKTGTTYYYKVAAVRKISGKYVQAKPSAYVKVKPALKKASITKITAGTRKITLTYSKIAGAHGYQIYRATSKNGTYKKVATTKSTTYTNKKLASKKTYYYKVRAYRIVNKKYVYGSFSSIKYKKTK